jgi:hypothetical protein
LAKTVLPGLLMQEQLSILIAAEMCPATSAMLRASGPVIVVPDPAAPNDSAGVELQGDIVSTVLHQGMRIP